MNRTILLLTLSIVFFARGSFAALHEGPSSKSSGASWADIDDLKDISLTDLQTALTLTPTQNGDMEAVLSIGPQHAEARERLRKALEGKPIFRILSEHLNEPVEIYTYDKKTNTYELETINGLGTILGAAISQPTPNLDGSANGASRSYLFKNNKGELLSSPAFTRPSESLTQIKIGILSLAAEEKNQKIKTPDLVWRQTTDFRPNQPPDKFVQYNPTSQAYDMEENPLVERINHPERPVVKAMTPRAQAILQNSQAKVGQAVRFGPNLDCWSFVQQMSGGNFGPSIGSFQPTSVRKPTLWPGQILNMANYNYPSRTSGSAYGSNHWAMIKRVNPDGTIEILHQNTQGKLYVVEDQINPNSGSGTITVYQP